MPLLQMERDKLVKMLKMTTSSHPGERDTAILLVNQFLKLKKITWEELLLRPPIGNQAGPSKPSQPQGREPPQSPPPPRPGQRGRSDDQQGKKSSAQGASSTGGNRKSQPSKDDLNWERFTERYPEEAEWIDDNAGTFDFAGSIHSWVRKTGHLTIDQMAAVRKCMSRDNRGGGRFR